MTRTEIGRRSDALWKDDERYHRRDLCDMVAYREDDVERLRELVADMWFWSYCGHMDHKSQEWQMKHISGVLDRARELGVEVDDG